MLFNCRLPPRFNFAGFSRGSRAGLPLDALFPDTGLPLVPSMPHRLINSGFFVVEVLLASTKKAARGERFPRRTSGRAGDDKNDEAADVVPPPEGESAVFEVCPSSLSSTAMLPTFSDLLRCPRVARFSPRCRSVVVPTSSFPRDATKLVALRPSNGLRFVDTVEDSFERSRDETVNFCHGGPLPPADIGLATLGVDISVFLPYFLLKEILPYPESQGGRDDPRFLGLIDDSRDRHDTSSSRCLLESLAISLELTEIKFNLPPASARRLPDNEDTTGG